MTKAVSRYHPDLLKLRGKRLPPDLKEIWILQAMDQGDRLNLFFPKHQLALDYIAYYRDRSPCPISTCALFRVRLNRPTKERP